jgi:hypothetical protein
MPLLPPLSPAQLVPIEVEIPIFDYRPLEDTIQRWRDNVCDDSELEDIFKLLLEKYVLGRVKDHRGRPYHPDVHEITFTLKRKASAVVLH